MSDKVSQRKGGKREGEADANISRNTDTSTGER